MTIDFEGDFKNDYMAGGIRQFPPPMGMAAIGDPKLTYKIGLTIAKQLSNIGVTQMYSPVCDVNINPKNPEIGVRSFSDDPEICAKHAVALIKGFQDGGIAATAKHFPGRGDSGDGRPRRARRHQGRQEEDARSRAGALQGGDRRRRQGHHDRPLGLPGVRRQVPDDAVGEDPDRAAARANWASTA